MVSYYISYTNNVNVGCIGKDLNVLCAIQIVHTNIAMEKKPKSTLFVS